MSALGARVSLVVLALVVWPSPLAAQRDRFVAAAQELAAALVTPEPARGSRLADAVDRLASSLREWDRRIAALEAERARTPDEPAPALHMQLVRQYLDRGRAAEAARELESAALNEPELHLLRALALDASGDAGAADAARRAAWQIDASHPLAAYYVVRRADAAAADREAARATLILAYRELVTSPVPQQPAPFPTVGVIHDSLARTPVVADDVTASGVALLVAHRYSEAVAALQADLERGVPPALGDEESTPTESPLAEFVRGRSAEEARRIGEARRRFEAAAAGTLAGRSALYAGIGRLAQIEGDFEAATVAFERAVRISPNDAAMRRTLAQAYAVEARTDLAFAELMAALLIDDRDAQAHAALGQMFLDEARDHDAVMALTRATELAPDAFETRYALAAALARVGRTADAARELETFERARREMIARQRQQMAGDVRSEEALRERLRQGDPR